MIGLLKRLFKRSPVSNVHAQTRKGVPLPSVFLSKDHAAGRGWRKTLANNARLARRKMAGTISHSPSPKQAAPAKAKRKTSNRVRKDTRPASAAGTHGAARTLKAGTKAHLEAAKVRRARLAGVKGPEKVKLFRSMISGLKQRHKSYQIKVDK